MAIDSIKLYEQIAKEKKLNLIYMIKVFYIFILIKNTEHALDVNKLYNQAGLKRIRITHDELILWNLH